MSRNLQEVSGGRGNSKMLWCKLNLNPNSTKTGLISKTDKPRNIDSSI